MHRTTHPSKEQVRAYMHQREGQRSPPPPPHEIRRLLGWATVAAGPPPTAGGATPRAAGHSSAPATLDWTAPSLPFPLTLGQWSLWLALQWMRCADGLWRGN